MSKAQLNLVLAVLLTGIGASLLFLLLSSAPPVDVAMRLEDHEAEAAARDAAVVPTDGGLRVFDGGGVFEQFDGAPGRTGSNWPGFRGPGRNNIAPPEERFRGVVGRSPAVLWSVELGEGHAGSAVWEGRVFVLDYMEEREGDALRCFSIADGKEIWRRSYRSPTKRNHGVSRTVPAVTAQYVVTMGPQCHVMCVDTETGAFKWGMDLVAEHGAEVPLWYTGQCPVIDDGVAVIAPGGDALMMGVDCATGEILWRTPNPDRWKMSHSSIMPMTILGKKMYVYCALGGVVGVSAEEEDRGVVLWKSAVWNQSVIAPSPVQIDERRVFFTAGYGGGSMMIELKRAGAGYSVQPLFERDKTQFGCEQQTPIFYRNHLFGVMPKDAGPLRGQFVCMNTDGELVWSSGKTERFGLGPFFIVDDKVLLLNDTGELTILEASTRGYRQLSRFRPLAGRDAWAPMAMVDGYLLLRDSRTLMCLDMREDGDS